jgi:hypothetical protein
VVEETESGGFSEAVNYTSESRRSYQFRHVGQCRALFKQRSARFEFTSDLLQFSTIFFCSNS